MRRYKGGSPRSLSREQIQRVLRWYRTLTRFRTRQGTLASLSANLGLTVVELRRALRGRYEGLALSFEQRDEIALWKARRQRFEKRHLSAHQLARSLGVSRSTVFLCIEKKGVYQTSVRGENPRPKGPSTIQTNAALLRAWGRKATDGVPEAASAAKASTRSRGAT